MTVGLIGESQVAIGLARLDIPTHRFTTLGDDWPELRALHFGSLDSVATFGADAVAAVVDHYGGKALISDDLSWRNGVIDAPPPEFIEASAALADVVRLNADDAAAIYPNADLDTVAATLLDQGPALVVITRGADGASAWTRNATKHCPAAQVEVVDTVGAGDAFVAALLSELGELSRDRIASLNKRELELVLDFASFVAGRTCERAGADPPYLADLF